MFEALAPLTSTPSPAAVSSVVHVIECAAEPHHRLWGHAVVEGDGHVDIGAGHRFASAVTAQKEPGELVESEVGMVGEDQLDRSADDRVDDGGVHPDDAIDGQTPVEDVVENRRRPQGPFDQFGAVAGAVDLFEHPEPGRRRRQHEVTCPEYAAQLAGPIDDRQVLGSGIEQRDQRLDRRAGELDRRGRVHHHLARGGVPGDSVADNPAAQHRIGDDPVGAVTRFDDRAVHVTVRQLPCDDGDGRVRADDQRRARDEVFDRAEHRRRGGAASGAGDVIGEEPGAAAGVERRLDQVARQTPQCWPTWWRPPWGRSGVR